MNGITGKPWDDDADVDTIDLGGGDITVGGPTITTESKVCYEVDADKWCTGVDATEGTTSERPFKIQKVGGTNTGDKLVISSDEVILGDNNTVRIIPTQTIGPDLGRFNKNFKTAYLESVSFLNKPLAIAGSGNELRADAGKYYGYSDGAFREFVRQGDVDVTFGGPIKTTRGTAALPSFTFGDDVDTGMFSGGVNHLGLSVNGGEKVSVDPTTVAINSSLTMTGPVYSSDGTVGAPSVTFDTDKDTGMFSGGANNLGFSVGGVEKLSVDATTVTVSDSLIVAGLGGDPANEYPALTAVDVNGTMTKSIRVTQNTDGSSMYLGIDAGSGSNLFNCTAIGQNALAQNTTGAENTAIGIYALATIVNGSALTSLGVNTSASDGLTNATMIGYNASGDKSYQITLGDSDVTETRPGGDNKQELGTTTNRWTDVHLSNSIKLSPLASLPALGTTGQVVFVNDRLHYLPSSGIWQAVLTEDVYTPTAFSGLQAWYDASDPTSMVQTGSVVASWTDLSGNSNNLNTVSGTPRTGDSMVNGRNVVNLDNESIGNSAALVNYDNHTIIWVGSVESLVTNDIFGTGSTTSGDALIVQIGTGLRGHIWRPTLNTIDSAWTITTNFSIYIQRLSNTTLDIIRNGGSDITSNTGVSLTTTPSKGIVIGNRTTTAGTFVGSVGELAVYDRDLSNSELNLLCADIGNKWGVTWTNL